MEEDEIFDKVMGLVDLKNKLMTQRRQLLSRIFEDKSLYTEFIEFMSLSKSPLVLFILNLAYNTILLVPIKAFFLSSHSSHRARIFFLIEFVSAIVAVVSGWLLFFSIHPNRVTTQIGNFFKEKLCCRFKFLSKAIEPDQLQMILYFTLNFRHGFILITRTLLGSCNLTEVAPIGTTAFADQFSCNPQAESFIFPMDSAFMTMMVPLLFSSIYREVRIPVITTGWLIAVGSLMTSAIILNSSPALIITIIYITLSALMILDTYREYLLFYWLVMKLKHTIELNHQLAEENRATEIRHMIANVAHDLKTPLSSFMTGIDIIANDIKDLYEKVRVNLLPEPNSSHHQTSCTGPRKHDSQRWIQLDQSEIIEIVEGIQSCLGNIYNTNTFMLMTVNRCLDYTKASNGLRLYPKPETVNLTETLAMPLQCIQTIQQKIHIQLLPYEEEGICSHIITDKQWLQENLLCLLSNAVKYSIDGDVLLRIRLQQKHVVKSKTIDENSLPSSSLQLQPLGRTVGIGASISEKYKVITPAPNNANFEPDIEQPESLRELPPSLQDEDQTLAEDIKTKPTADTSSSRLVPFLLLNLWTSSKRHTPEDHKIIPTNKRQSSITESTSRVSVPTSTPTTTRRKLPLFSRGGEKERTKRTTSSVMETFLVFEVIDTGIGMSDESMKQIFYPFKQNQRLVGGTGLGLYSLSKRIEALEGNYGVKHREDGKKGSIFWFSIPYEPDLTTATMHAVTSDHNDIVATSSSSRSAHTLDLFPFTAPSSTHQKSDVNVTKLLGVPAVTTSSSNPNDNNHHTINPTEMTSSSSSSLKILLVEDTASMAKMISTMLRRQHHEVMVVENGQKALDLLFEDSNNDLNPLPEEKSREEDRNEEQALVDVTEEEITIGRVVWNRTPRVPKKPSTTGNKANSSSVVVTMKHFDVILMDFQMPVMDGLEATRKIREREQLINEQLQYQQVSPSHQLIIGISASSDHEIMKNAFQAGIDDFLPKPFSMESFGEAMKRLQMKFSSPLLRHKSLK